MRVKPSSDCGSTRPAQTSPGSVTASYTSRSICGTAHVVRPSAVRPTGNTWPRSMISSAAGRSASLSKRAARS
jgi:hypothetical protein